MEPENAALESFFFIQMSDPQLGMITANEDFAQEVDLTNKAVAAVNRLRPAFVIVTGDMVNEPGDEGQAEEAKRLLDQILAPLYFLPGNHDVGDVPSEDLLRWYRGHFGRDWYSFTCCGRCFIVLNSCLIFNGSGAPNELQKQWDWLSGELENHQEDDCPPIVFMHHPLFLGNRDEENQYFNIPKTTRLKYLELFDRYGIRTIINGHLHQNNITGDDQIEVITTGPVGLSLGSEPSGLRIFHVYGERIEHHYYGLDDVPEEVVLKS